MMSHVIKRREKGRRLGVDVGAAEIAMSLHADLVVNGRQESCGDGCG